MPSAVASSTNITEYFKEVPIPSELPTILKDLAREVVRNQPSDIYIFSLEYFEKKVASRNASIAAEIGINKKSKIESVDEVIVEAVTEVNVRQFPIAEETEAFDVIVEPVAVENEETVGTLVAAEPADKQFVEIAVDEASVESHYEAEVESSQSNHISDSIDASATEVYSYLAGLSEAGIEAAAAITEFSYAGEVIENVAAAPEGSEAAKVYEYLSARKNDYALVDSEDAPVTAVIEEITIEDALIDQLAEEEVTDEEALVTADDEAITFEDALVEQVQENHEKDDRIEDENHGVSLAEIDQIEIPSNGWIVSNHFSVVGGLNPFVRDDIVKGASLSSKAPIVESTPHIPGNFAPPVTDERSFETPTYDWSASAKYSVLGGMNPFIRDDQARAQAPTLVFEESEIAVDTNESANLATSASSQATIENCADYTVPTSVAADESTVAQHTEVNGPHDPAATSTTTFAEVSVEPAAKVYQYLASRQGAESEEDTWATVDEDAVDEVSQEAEVPTGGSEAAYVYQFLSERTC